MPWKGAATAFMPRPPPVSLTITRGAHRTTVASMRARIAAARCRAALAPSWGCGVVLMTGLSGRRAGRPMSRGRCRCSVLGACGSPVGQVAGCFSASAAGWLRGRRSASTREAWRKVGVAARTTEQRRQARHKACHKTRRKRAGSKPGPARCRKGGADLLAAHAQYKLTRPSIGNGAHSATGSRLKDSFRPRASIHASRTRPEGETPRARARSYSGAFKPRKSTLIRSLDEGGRPEPPD